MGMGVMKGPMVVIVGGVCLSGLSVCVYIVSVCRIRIIYSSRLYYLLILLYLLIPIS